MNAMPCPATSARPPRLWVSATLLAVAGLAGLGAAPSSWASASFSASAAAPAANQASAGPVLDPAWIKRIEAQAGDAARAAFGPGIPVRVELAVGALDPRLTLAPCQRVEAAIPAGHRPWGRSRIALRCLEGPVSWNVSVPLTVKVYAPAVVATRALSAGALLAEGDLALAEVDWAEHTSPVLALPALGAGRTLTRPIAAGAAVRQADLKPRQWFAAGDSVRLVAVGPGFSVSGEGVAMNPGLEGQTVRVRTENGRVVTGRAAGDRRVEVLL